MIIKFFLKSVDKNNNGVYNKNIKISNTEKKVLKTIKKSVDKVSTITYNKSIEGSKQHGIKVLKNF